MNTPLWALLLIPVISGGLGFIGSVVGNYVTFRLNEKSRRLDLLKILYPDRLAQSKLIMNAANELRTAAFRLNNALDHDMPDTSDRIAELDSKWREFVAISRSNEWVVTKETFGICMTITGMSAAFLCNPIKGLLNEDRLEDGFSDLAESVRGELHIPELDKVIARAPKWKRTKSNVLVPKNKVRDL